MGFIVSALWYVGTAVASWWLSHGRQKKTTESKPGAFSEDAMPTTSETQPIPVVWGCVRLDAANLLWYGAAATRDVQYEGTTVGHQYYVTLQYGLCLGPIDRVLAVEWDELHASIHGRIDGTHYDRLFYRQPQLFGGPFEEGGIYTEIRAYKGTADQPPDAHLEAKVGSDLPGYPHLAYLVMRGNPYPHSTEDPCLRVLLESVSCPCSDYSAQPAECISERSAYVGTSPQLKSMAVVVRRIDECNPLELTGGAHWLGTGANPANMLYEIITDEIWGLDIPESPYIATSSFLAAAATLADEEFGLSMTWTGDEVREIIEEILRHIDGILVLHPETGLLELRLIRGDYAVEELPVFGPNELRDFRFNRPELQTLPTTIRVTYTDYDAGFKTLPVVAPNLAAIQARGEEVVEEVAYAGVANSALAQKLAARDMKAKTYPLARISFTVNRCAWSLRQGSPFRLDWPELGISGMVCRVTSIGPGDLVKGEITIDAVEDVFGLGGTVYGPIPPSGWEDPFQSE